jgi:hypothetical protein
MNHILRLIIFTLLCVPVYAQLDPIPASISARATGYGTNPQAALTDAFANAVAQAVDEYMPSEFYVQNGGLIDEIIRPRAQSYVASYNVDVPFDGEKIQIVAEVPSRSFIDVVIKTNDTSWMAIDGSAVVANTQNRHRPYIEPADEAPRLIEDTVRALLRSIDVQIVRRDKGTAVDGRNVRLGLTVGQKINAARYTAAVSELERLFSIFEPKVSNDNPHVRNTIGIQQLDKSIKFYTFADEAFLLIAPLRAQLITRSRESVQIQSLFLTTEGQVLARRLHQPDCLYFLYADSTAREFTIAPVATSTELMLSSEVSMADLSRTTHLAVDIRLTELDESQQKWAKASRKLRGLKSSRWDQGDDSLIELGTVFQSVMPPAAMKDYGYGNGGGIGLELTVHPLGNYAISLVYQEALLVADEAQEELKLMSIGLRAAYRFRFGSWGELSPRLGVHYTEYHYAPNMDYATKQYFFNGSIGAEYRWRVPDTVGLGLYDNFYVGLSADYYISPEITLEYFAGSGHHGVVAVALGWYF